MLSEENYRYLYGKLNVKKIPKDISNKLDSGEDFTEAEETLIKDIIEKDIEQNRKKEYRFVDKEIANPLERSDKEVEMFKKIALGKK